MTSQAAVAQEICYRITDLGPIDSPPGELGAIEKPIRINERGEVAFTAWDLGLRQGYLWLPQSSYGLVAGVRHNLSILVGTGDPSAATDLNNAPNDRLTIVGARNSQPYVWQFEPAGLFDHGFLWQSVNAAQLQETGFAYGVTDFGGTDETDVDPYIVGVTNTTPACSPPGIAFRAQWNNAGTYEQLDPPAAVGWSAAVDVAKRGEPVAVGFGEDCRVFAQCEPSLTPMAWDTVPPTNTDTLLHTLTPLGGAQARGINHLGYLNSPDVVGLDRNAGVGADCEDEASFWDTFASDAAGLPIEAGGDLTDNRVAESVNNPDIGGEIVIVGQNADVDLALAWIGNPANGWTVVDLTTAISDCCNESLEWLTLDHAFDVNDDGLIVGIGTRNTIPPEAHYFLLTPNSNCDCCLGDVNGDGLIDVQDLNAVLAAWGPCPGCPEDFNCDDVVDVEDLLIVLAEWGVCDGQAASGLGMPLETALSTLGFQSVAEFKSWATTATVSEAQAMGELLHVFISPPNGGQ